MKKEKVLFIINPIAGTKNKKHIPDLVKGLIDRGKYDFETAETTGPGHAEELVKEGIRNDYLKFIAVGGDGTMNEVSKVLLNTSYPLGIVPAGSGNGLARHLGIPLSVSEAIKLLNTGRIACIDSATVNDSPFFCTSGIGFDAHIGKLFAESTTRGLNTYVKTTLREFFNYNPGQYTIRVNGQSIDKQAFLISFANASQYGNNAYISPQADIQDGLIDLCMLSPFPKYKALSIGLGLFNKTVHKSPYLKIIRAKEIEIERELEGAIHLDGEPYEMGKTLKVKVNPQSLNVIVP